MSRPNKHGVKEHIAALTIIRHTGVSLGRFSGNIRDFSVGYKGSGALNIFFKEILLFKHISAKI